MSNPTPVAPGASLLGITTAPTTQYNDVSTNPSVNCADVIADADVRVGDLARQISNISTSELQLTKTASTIGGLRNANPFEDCTKYPELDPASDKFSARKWAKTLIYLNNNHVDANGNLEELRAGVSFRNLDVHGFGKETDYQKNVANIWLGLAEYAKGLFGVERKRKIQILKDFEGVVRNGEMLVVLGRPGSGCSTLLKTISGDTHGLFVDENSQINYQGIPKEVMHKNFRGEVVYQAETDVHFPHLTVGDTLGFAAEARAPHHRPFNVSRKVFATHMRDVIMAMFGLSHTINTMVGSDFVRGVSGGERKRVSIAEVALSGAPLQCWDNSTRGLDSATALEFVRTLRMNTELMGNTCFLAIYQAPQAAYDEFDKVILLYEGRQIYFGKTTEAQRYFEDMGYVCPPRSTTPDFLTSLTNPVERVVAPGFENKVPRTPDEFVERWKMSDVRQKLVAEIDQFETEFPLGGDRVKQFRVSHGALQSRGSNPKSPYTLSIPMQIKLCMGRGFKRLRNDLTITLFAAFGNCMMALIIGSVFFNMKEDASTFYSRGVLLFFAILMNAFSSSLEILSLYAQRPVVEKHARYAFYHPFAEAISSMLVDMPAKIFTAVTFNVTLYFMTNLRREASAFFIFFLFSFFCTLAMSNIFRTIAALSKTIHQAMPLAAIFILALVIYTGFAIPIRDMRVFLSWIRYINPISYAFEALMVNEFHDRKFPCVHFTPSSLNGVYPQYDLPAESLSHVCATPGSVAGQSYVDGTAYVSTAFGYLYSRLWHDFGILIAFFVFFLVTYLVSVEYISSAKSRGEVLVFRRGKVPKPATRDLEGTSEKRSVVKSDVPDTKDVSVAIQKQTSIFHWEDVCYDIKIKDEDRRILDHVDGWVEPGKLTGLMGVSGAGKTTLLDVLANRVTVGVVTGNMCVDGRQRDGSFQRKTGYAQQQDLHLSTSTVREALQFSAIMRQPRNITTKEKLDYVEEVIDLLEMNDYADAVVGVPGEGLNVEQRKRLTIGVELAAKPELLLFLDEPTSGLDSQTAWSICNLMRKLANNGQAILCTIHQPSAILFQEFDRLLFLAKGGKPVYFGSIGDGSNVLIDYFERNGGPACPTNANPAEWMLEVIGAAPGCKTDKDWPAIWNASPEKASVKAELANMASELSKIEHAPDKSGSSEFAMPFWAQAHICIRRVFQQYWRTPTYIYSKLFLCAATALFIGFSFFGAAHSQQGLQNQMFAIFMFLTLFGNLSQQMMPHFVTQRSLYEARERPSKVYTWKAFMLANIVVEIPWQTFMAVITYFCMYYPIGLDNNARWTDALTERSALFFLLIWAFYMWATTFTQLLISFNESAENGGNLGQLLFSLCLIFCGVLASPDVFPRFWIFIYRISPLTYLVSALLATGLANAPVVCSDIEVLNFKPPQGMSCGNYMANYTSVAGGTLYNPLETSGDCRFCAMDNTNTFLDMINSNYDNRWRNFGFIMAYCVFNIGGAFGLYWIARVPKGASKKKSS